MAVMVVVEAPNLPPLAADANAMGCPTRLVGSFKTLSGSTMVGPEWIGYDVAVVLVVGSFVFVGGRVVVVESVVEVVVVVEIM